ncbi:unnamed protein product [Bursaphelenchus xylophilus]|uniref:(pine wood nematode) hypothetical protein n=1 Tax=Bursaphelenchus xylophilus TaxID=6326 RepID=A0A1I7SWF2_BURXY|nr:unnamed protein product [Bursaphelenchus xylophilus]CAG9099318.1 unnamed protein product [Bursaphelenchus xylophilus]
MKVTIEARVSKGKDRKEVGEKRNDLIQYLINKGSLPNWTPVLITCPDLNSSIDYVLVGLDSDDDTDVHITTESQIVFYSSKDFEPCVQEIFLDENSNEGAVSSTVWEIPNTEFDSIWENLFFDNNLKGELLRYASGVLKLSSLGVDRNVIDLNRLILLHGPPGSGKTSLCKGLAQRIASRYQETYKRSIFVEVNSHSLFSKWFSESGKLVQKLFDQVAEIAEEPRSLVIMLVDEVESLVMSRSSAHSNDPSDSIRAVNAVITQIDRIRRYPNVLVLTTSNITDALDSAFLDRTDISKYVGNPSKRAASIILSKAVNEMIRVGVFDGPIEVGDNISNILNRNDNQKLSGRILKKAPVLAYSKMNNNGKINLESYLRQLESTLVELTLRP